MQCVPISDQWCLRCGARYRSPRLVCDTLLVNKHGELPCPGPLIQFQVLEREATT